MLTRLDHALLSFHESAVAKALIPLGELLYFLVPAMTDDAALSTHVRETGGVV